MKRQKKDFMRGRGERGEDKTFQNLSADCADFSQMNNVGRRCPYRDNHKGLPLLLPCIPLCACICVICG